MKAQLDQSSVPSYTTEHVFSPPRRWRFDIAWPEHMLALEIEGGVSPPLRVQGMLPRTPGARLSRKRPAACAGAADAVVAWVSRVTKARTSVSPHIRASEAGGGTDGIVQTSCASLGDEANSVLRTVLRNNVAGAEEDGHEETLSPTCQATIKTSSRIDRVGGMEREMGRGVGARLLHARIADG